MRKKTPSAVMGGTYERKSLFPQRIRNLPSNLPRPLNILRIQTNRRHPRMPPAAKLLRNRSQIHIRIRLAPRIRPNRNLRASSRSTHPHRIKRLRMQIIRNKFVIPLQIQIAHIKINHATPRIPSLSHNLNRPPMPLEQRPQMPRDQRQLHNLSQRHSRQIRNQQRHQIRLRRRLNHQSNLHSRLAQPHRRFRRCKLRPINNVPPINQFSQRLRIKSKFLSSNGSQKFSAGFVGRIVKLLPRPIRPKISRILRRKKRALMMIKPPSQPRRTRILEIHDGILVAIKHPILKRLRSLMRHPHKMKRSVSIDPLAVKPRKNRRRTRPIKTLIVKEDLNVHFLSRTLRTSIQSSTENQKEWTDKFPMSRSLRMRPSAATYLPITRVPRQKARQSS